MRISLFFLIFCFFTYASVDCSIAPYLTSENDTLSLVDDTVDAFNGKLVQMDKDIEINGSHPLELHRYYDGGHHFDSEVGYGVGLSFPIFLKFSEDKEKQNLIVEQRMGFEVLCTVTKQKTEKKSKKAYYKGSVDLDFFKHGYTNCCEALLRGEPSLLALQVEGNSDQFVVTLGNGTKRYYSYFLSSIPDLFYRLSREDRPDGTHRYFSYKDNETLLLKQVWTTNPSNTLVFNRLNFAYTENYVQVEASNGQTVFYHQKIKKGKAQNYTGFSYSEIKFSQNLLEEVTGKHLPVCEYRALSRSHYTGSLFSTKEINHPDGRFIKVSYDDYERISNLWTSGTNVPLYKFNYHDDHTTVVDANGGTQRFYYHKRLLVKHEEPHRSHYYSWDDKGQLLKQILTDNENNHLIERNYRYDSRGNVTETKVTGCINVTGSKDTYVVRYHYSNDGHNLVCEEHPDGYSIGYGYLPGTNLLSGKLIVSNQQIVEREFYHYDANGIQIGIITDDGSGLTLEDLSNVTYRKFVAIAPQLDPNLPGMTLPSIIQESYQDLQGIHLLNKTEKIYSHGDLLAEEKIFDAQGNYCYSLRYEYNDKRELISETDPLNFQTIYLYDNNGNKIYEEKIGSGRKILYGYDTANRLTVEYEDADGQIFSTSHAYDSLGNLKETTDLFGQKTTFLYDLANRETASIDPLGYAIAKSYDAHGNITHQIDQDGHLITTVYNMYGKPLEIHYPDGTEKRFAYNLHGHLFYEKERNGLETIYETDYKGRIKSATTFSNGISVKTIRKSYKGPNLILEVDPMGNETSYTYDPAGRLISTQQGEKITRFEYDSLGRLSKTITPERTEIKEYDFLGQVIEARIEDSLGTIFQKTCYAYDIHGNCISQKSYTDADNFIETLTTYNSRSLPTLTLDACGNPTTIAYHYSDHLIKGITDSLGRKKLEVYDPLDRLKKLFIFSATGPLIAHQTFGYDGRGNQVLRKEDVLCDGQALGAYTIETAYDSMGQKLSDTEQNKKITRYSYHLGRLHTITNPDDIILAHTYDNLSRLTRLNSSDGTIDYHYTYDLNDNLLTAHDRVNQTLTTRSYDIYNRQIFEKQATGLEIAYSYDNLDRLKEVSFQKDKIGYAYNPISLLSAKRYNQNNLLYDYHQTTDWQGKILSSQFPHIKLTYTWDPIGRCLSIDSPSYKQNATYNSMGCLTNLSVKDPLGLYNSTFTYDDLDQLTSETGPFVNQYQHDSLNNRRSKNQVANVINDLNQVTQDSKNNYVYDPNGRRLTKQDATYTYDALGRLINYNDKQSIDYLYDPFGRLLQRQTAESKEHYLYQFDTEIASFEKEQCSTFKALYGTHAPFAIELKSIPYSPIRNHRGNICILLADKPIGTYRYNAFGEFSQQGLSSPWLFSSQRYDPETNLYHYAKRNYDPSLGIWLTPDPSGFVDGPNLYAYVKNNPLTFIDPYGLWMEESSPSRTIRRAQQAYNTASRIGRDFSDTCKNIHERCKQFRQNAKDLEEYGQGFGRGVIDDTSFGLSSVVFGEYNPKTDMARNGYLAGTGTSMAAGCIYGAGELKGAIALIKGTANAGRQGFTAAKTLVNAKTAGRAGEKAKVIFKKFSTSTVSLRKETAKEVVIAKGRQKNFLNPDQKAIGEHTVFKKNAETKKMTNYETFRPQTNPRNPNPWESVYRLDNTNPGINYHYNKIFNKKIYEPHFHDPKCPGGVRSAELWEISN